MLRFTRALGALVVAVGGLAGIATRPAAAVVTPTISVGDISVWEGDAGSVQVSVPVDLSVPTTVPVSVRFAVASTQANASDFVARTGTLRFKAGVSTGKINVKVLADTVQEPDEDIAVTLSTPVGATIDDGAGTITIHDDDAPGDPNHLDATIGDVTVQEADGGKHYVYVPVTLSAPAPTTVKVAVGATAGCTDAATSGQDFTGSVSQNLSFPAGARARQLKFTIVGDTTPEAIERIEESIRVTLGPAVVRAAEGGVEIIDDPSPSAQPSDTGIERVSVSSHGDEAYSPIEVRGCLVIAFGSDVVDTSSDGSAVLFWSAADNLVPNDTNNTSDLFVRDTVAGTTERVSVGTGDSQASVSNGSGAMSADGRYVLFPSHDASLVPTGTTDSQLFVHDRVTHATQLVSVTTAGTTVPGGAYIGDISGNGRVVVFRSEGSPQGIYVRDLVAGTTQYIAASSTTGGTPRLSSDGRYVSFVSPDATLVPGDTNNFPDVFVRDRTTGATERINVTTSGAQEVTTPSSDGSWVGRINLSDPQITPDGRYVTFTSYASNVASAVTPMIRDRVLHTTAAVTVPLTPPTGGGCADSAATISDDGRFVALQAACSGPQGSYAVAGASRGIYVVDRQLGTFRRADVLNDGTEADGDPVYGFNSRISGDGQWIAFGSYADNLVPNDDNGQRDVFVAPAGD